MSKAIPEEYSLRTIAIKSSLFQERDDKTWAEAVQSVGNRVSRFELSVGIPEPHTPDNTSDNTYSSADLEWLNEMFPSEAQPLSDDTYKARVFGEYRISVDGNRVGKDYSVDPGALLTSAYEYGEFYIFTCDCFIPDCAGINEGIQVIHKDGKTVWITKSLKKVERFVFDTREYQDAIILGLMNAVETVAELGIEGFPPTHESWTMPATFLKRLPEWKAKMKAEDQGRWVKIPPDLLDVPGINQTSDK